jgi:hypothetical protein
VRVALVSVAVVATVVGPVLVAALLPMSGATATIVILLVSLGAVVIMALLETQVHFDGVAAGRLAAGRCPKCLYNLTDLPPEEDECTVCPECGAAWVLPGKAKKE